MVEIVIEYGAVQNDNRARGGFMPVLWVNGRRRGDTFGRGLDLDAAMAAAEGEAREEAGRWRGDYAVTVRERGAA